MINQTIKGICQTLKDEFNFPVYTNQPSQDLETPSFLLKLLTVTYQREVDRYHRVNSLFNIQYFPESKLIEECYEMADKLYLLLNHLNDVRIRASQSSATVKKQVLHFEVGYSTRYHTVEAGELFTQLQWQGGLKND